MIRYEIIIYYKRMAYEIIIHKPKYSGRQAIHYRCRRFDVLLFRLLAQSVAAMTTVTDV